MTTNDVTNTLIGNLNPVRSVFTVLGILCNAPQALRNPEQPLEENDFYQAFHKNIFAAINNIAYSNVNVENITPVDIDNYLAQYPQHYKIWEQHNGFEYMSSAIENVNLKTYKSNYWRLKKFAMLRDYVNAGIDVTSLYDYRLNDLKQQEEQMKALDKMSIDQMVDHFNLRMLSLRDKWSMGEKRKSFMAGDNLDGLLERLKEAPEMGYPFKNGYYNAIFRGQRLKKFMLRSAGTGVGKTRLSLADMCNIAVDEMWDYKTKSYQPNGPANPVLFISTELEQQELQTGMLAYITGVDEDLIKNGKYSKEIEERLKHGIKILQRSPIYAEYIDDFSISDIETIIEEHILEHGTKYVAFDYIQMVPKLARTMQEAFAGSLREDQILVQLSAALKLLANKYDVYIVSATQVNRNAKEHEMRDTTSLRGGSATADKVDHGVMVFRVTGKDLENLKHVFERGFNNQKPNFCHYVYKNRGGSKVGCIIWTKYHGGVIREEELFVTDLDFNLLDVENLHVTVAGEPKLPEVEIPKENKFVDEHMDEDETNFVPIDEVPEF
jgi:replicative DNA helicase